LKQSTWLLENLSLTLERAVKIYEKCFERYIIRHLSLSRWIEAFFTSLLVASMVFGVKNLMVVLEKRVRASVELLNLIPDSIVEENSEFRDFLVVSSIKDEWN
jgi:hypothetical protein